MVTPVVVDHTEASLSELILAKWGAVESQGNGRRYVVALQVNNGAGFSYGRTLDAVVFDTWPSEGLALHGLEVKISKADLRRELMNPAKSAEFVRYLDTFSVVAPSEVLDAAARELIPKRWGLYAPDCKGGLRTIRRPVYLHDEVRDGAVMNRSLAAAFARALVQRSLSREAEEAAAARGYAQGVKSVEGKLERAQSDLETIRASLAAFEEASGVSIGEWAGGRVGEEFAAFRRLRGAGYAGGLPVDKARAALERLEELTGDLEALRAYLGAPA